MPTELLEPDSLLEQLKSLNHRLLELEAGDIAALAKVIERRAQLLSRAGHLLRTAVNPNMLKDYRETLEQAVESGDIAVRRLLSTRQKISCNYQGLTWLDAESSPADSDLACRM